MNNLYFAELDPSIKIFIASVSIIGPICILFVIILLKQIESKDPERIRWR